MSRCLPHFALSALALVSCCGIAAAVPTIDGTASPADAYGPALYLNTQNPTSAGDNTPVLSAGTPELVTTGIEFRIPLAAIGSPAGAIRFSAMINSGDRGFLSNQVIRSIVANTPNLGTTNLVNFSTIAGDQNLSITPTLITTATPVIDGTLDAAYGTLAAASPRLQRNYTGFGDATHGNLTGRNGGSGSDGSEIDGIYVMKDATFLYVFLAGNLEDNGNKLELFIDSIAGSGQNIVAGTATNLDGLRFDANFIPDFLYEVNIAGTSSPTVSNVYLDTFALNTDGTAVPTYLGTNRFLDTPGTAPTLYTASVDETDPNNPITVYTPFGTTQLAVNNSNIGGVIGQPLTGSNPDRANGSEIDGVYGRIEGNTLYLMMTGNLATGFIKLDMFFDVRPGGQNRLRGNTQVSADYRGNPNIDFGALQRMGSTDAAVQAFLADPNATEPTDGLKFDAGFAADYWISMTNGGDPISVFTNATQLRSNGKRADLNGGGQDYGSFEGGAKPSYNPINFSGRNLVDGVGPVTYSPDGNGDLLASYAPRSLSNQISDFDFPPYNAQVTTLTPNLIVTAIDNSNVAGVTATTASAALSGPVTTGMELAVDLTELGWDGASPIKVCGFINNDPRDSISNQVFGGLPSNAPALGNPRLVDFSAIPGNQYIEFVFTPTPACLADIVGGDGNPPADASVDGNDFQAFLNAFAAGC